jgi:hypothetical protein
MIGHYNVRCVKTNPSCDGTYLLARRGEHGHLHAHILQDCEEMTRKGGSRGQGSKWGEFSEIDGVSRIEGISCGAMEKGNRRTTRLYSQLLAFDMIMIHFPPRY